MTDMDADVYDADPVNLDKVPDEALLEEADVDLPDDLIGHYTDNTDDEGVDADEATH